jgi:sporulation protein YlmC with PRC-barrel domain
MKTAVLHGMLLVLAELAVFTAAQAQPAPSQPQARQAKPQVQAGSPSAATPGQANLFRGSRIIGTSVRDRNDRKIGQIRDLILDSRRGEVAYAVVNFGGVLGVGAKYHAVPWQALERSDDGRYYVLGVDQKTIADAPAFDRGRWPDMSNQAWARNVDNYWSKAVGKADTSNSLNSGVSGTNSHSGK